MSVDFTWGGRRHRLTQKQVIEKLRGARLGTVRKHAVEVDGVLHPVKEAMAFVTGEDVLDFNTNQARSAFRRLGFQITRVE